MEEWKWKKRKKGKKKGLIPPSRIESNPVWNLFFFRSGIKPNQSKWEKEPRRCFSNAYTYTHTYIYLIAFPRELSFTLNERATTASFGLNCIQYYDCTKGKRRRKNRFLRGDGRPHHLFSKRYSTRDARGQVFCSLSFRLLSGLTRIFSLLSSPLPRGARFLESRDAPPVPTPRATRLQRCRPKRGWKGPRQRGEEIFAITIAVGGNERWLKCIFGKIG